MRLIAAVAVLAVLVGTAPASGAETGPALRVPSDELDASLRCPAGFVHPDREPVLLVHGTAVTPEEHWGWNYAEALPAAGFDVCLVRLPDRALGDIQVSAEYVVHAVRTMAAESGSTVDVIGHSQGTLEPRWAVRWWPDVRAAIDDLVMLAGPHHGTFSADGSCIAGSCFPAAWQMRHGSTFLGLLNTGDETPGEVEYSSIYSATDELVQPPTTAFLDGASNVLVQDVCPVRPVHHVGLNEDRVVWELTVDALVSEGAADPEGVSSSACFDPFMPNVNALDAISGNLAVYGNGGLAVAAHDTTDREPEPAPYTEGG